MESLDRVHLSFLAGQEEALGRLAVKRGLISEQQFDEALRLAQSGSRRLGSILAERGWLKTDQLFTLLEDQIQEEITRLVLTRPDAMPPEVKAQLSNPAMNFDEFTLVSKLGRGGAGEVWKAWDRQLHRWVAIKRPLILPDSESALERFRREVLASARLSHPHIVPVYRVAEHEGRPYIVMQLVEGKTLDELRLPLRRALEAVRAAAHALHHAHQHGVVHRDIKPENLMVDQQGAVWVLDFGLANLMEGRSITVTGTVMGTPSYMSPEQARGEPAAKEAPTDVYSLGATLFTLVTGRPPFEGESIAEIVHRVVEAEPTPPSRIDPQVPPEVETIVLKAMEKLPERRYPTAEEMAQDLQRYLDGEPIHAKRPSYTYRLKKTIIKHRWLAATAMVAALAIGSLGLYLFIGAKEADRLRDTARRDLDQAERTEDLVERLRLYERAAPHLPQAKAKAAELSASIARLQQQARDAKPHFEQGLDRFRSLDRLLGLADDHSAEIQATVKECLSSFEKALEIHPSYGEAALQIGRVHMEVQDRDQAQEWATKAIQISPELTTAYLLRALVNTDRYERLRHESRGGGTKPETEESRALEKLIRDDLALAEKWHKDVAEVDLAQGVLLFAQGSYVDAALRLEAYLKRVPSDWRALTLLSHACLHVPDYSKAIEWSTRSLQVRPRYALSYNERGAAHNKSGNLDAAIADFSRVTELDPKRTSGWLNRANSLCLKREWEKAVPDFQKALELSPKDERIYFQLGITLFRLRRHAEAVELFDRLISIAPENGEAYHSRGNARRFTRDFKGAVVDAEKAASLLPEDPEVRGDLGLAYEAYSPHADKTQELLQAAKREYELALRLAPPEWRSREMIEKHLGNVQRKLDAPK